MGMKQGMMVAALLASLAVPGLAQDVDGQIEAMARAWLPSQAPAADAASLARTLDCMMVVLRQLPAHVKATMVAQDDFEDSLDAVVFYDGSLERPLQACF
jgi:hypothetical protein